MTVGAGPGAISPTDLARNDRGSDRVFGAPVRRIDSWIKQEGPDGREFALEMRGEPLDVRRATRSVKPFGEASDQVSAGDRQAMCGDDTGQVAGADGERLLQDRPAHADRIRRNGRHADQKSFARSCASSVFG